MRSHAVHTFRRQPSSYSSVGTATYAVSNVEEEDERFETAVTNVLAAEKGPLTVAFADTVAQRVHEKKQRNLPVRQDAEVHDKCNMLFSILASDLGIDATEEEQAASEQAVLGSIGKGMDGEPMWQVVDTVVERHRLLQRWQQGKENGHKDLPSQDDSKQLWDPFWGHYRGDSGKVTHVEVAEMRACSGPLASQARTRPLTGTIPRQGMAEYPGFGLKLSESMTSFAPAMSKASKKSPPATPSTTGGCPPVSSRIMQEFEAFESHERSREFLLSAGSTGVNGVPSPSNPLLENSSDSEDVDNEIHASDSDNDDHTAWRFTIEAATGKQPNMENLSVSATRSLGLTKKEDALASVQEAPASARESRYVNAKRTNLKLATEESETESSAKKKVGLPAVRADMNSGSPRRVATHAKKERCGRLALPHVIRPRCPPVHHFRGFDDYKQWQATKSESVRKAQEAMATPWEDEILHELRQQRGVETGPRMEEGAVELQEDLCSLIISEPQSSWGSPVREHELICELRRRRDQDTAGLPKPAKLAKRSKLRSARLHNSGAFFNRPWSRERNVPKTRVGPDKQYDPVERFATICRNTGVHPQPISVQFLTVLPPKLDTRGADYADEDILALAAALPYEGTIEAVDVGENPRITDASVTKLVEAISSRHSHRLHILKLDHCSRLGRDTLQLVNQLIRDCFRNLQKIDLSGISIGMQEYMHLSKAVQGHKHLRNVHLMDTGLGIFDKSHAMDVIQNIMSNRHLQCLDLGWNSLDSSSFKALGGCVVAHKSLQQLGLANTGPVRDPVLHGSPLLLFLECLAADKTLTSLDISINNLGDEAPLVLECAACRHERLQCIDISTNPLALAGKRSLLRLLAHPGCSDLTRINMEDCSGRGEDKDNKGHWCAEPSGIYNMDMAQPAQRALLRLLLMRLCEGPSAAAPDSLVRGAILRCNGVESNFSFGSLRRDKNGNWEVPMAGELNFSLNAAPAVVSAEVLALTGARKVVEHIIRRTRYPLTNERKTLAVLSLVKRETDEQSRYVLLAAMSRDFLLTPEQVESLCHTRIKYPNSGKDPVNTCARVLPCLIGAANVRQGIQCTNGLSDLLRVVQEGGNLLSLNLENPTGHYDFECDEPADRTAVEQLLLLNRWEAHLWKAAGRTDISQNGNLKNFRNEVYGHRAFVWCKEEWAIHGYESLSFDYVSLRRPPAKAQAITDECLEDMCDSMKVLMYGEGIMGIASNLHTRATITERNSRAMRKSTANGHQQKSAVYNICEEKEDGEQEDETTRCTHRWEWDRNKALLTDTCVIWALRAVSSHFYLRCDQMRQILCLFYRSEARRDVLTFLLLRTIDWPINNKLVRCKFSEDQWQELVNRLGFIVMFPFFQPECSSFRFDFSIPEQRRAAHFLVCIACGEDPFNVKKARIDPNGPRDNPNWDPLVMGVPRTWENFDNIPCKGVLEATYACSMDYVRLKVRRRHAAAVAGWSALPSEQTSLDKMILWWAVLDEVPEEVIMVLEFFFSRYMNLSFAAALENAFGDLDTSGDGSLTLRELIDSMRQLGFKPAPPGRGKAMDDTMAAIERNLKEKKSVPVPRKIAGKIAEQMQAQALEAAEKEETRLKDVITVVYRFLDPNNDADVTLREFNGLEGIWRELQQTKWEFIRHMRDCFGSLTDAWAFADEDDSGSLDWPEFKRLVRRWDFDGPIKHIFAHMDIDGDNTIGKDEFILLDSSKPPSWR